jgi:hypothetical protein
MDYLLISDFIEYAKYRLTVIEKKRHDLVKKAAWSAEDEYSADALDDERARLEEELEEACDALSQCD